jgi:hypothetical protein
MPTGRKTNTAEVLCSEYKSGDLWRVQAGVAAPLNRFGGFQELRGCAAGSNVGSAILL